MITKIMLKESSSQREYSKILQAISDATEYSQRREDVKQLLTSVIEYCQSKLRNL
jgi:hypothetical protein